MKYHKIRNVAKETCTAEQKIAYNLAFRVHINYQDDFNRVNSINPGSAKHDAVKLASDAIRTYTLAYDYKPGKYDLDAIQAALNAGLYEYLCKPFIATDYERIGKAFPAHYLPA